MDRQFSQPHPPSYLQHNLQQLCQEIKLKPSYQRYVKKARCQLNLKKYHPCKQTCKQAIKYSPQRQVAYCILAKVECILGDYHESKKNHKKSITLNGKYSQGYFAYGFTYYHEKDYVEGLKMFEKGIACELHNNSIAYIGRAQGFAEMGEEQNLRKNMNYAQKALNQINQIDYLSQTQRQITKKGIQRYKEVVKNLQRVSTFHNLGSSYKIDRQRDIINKISSAINLDNINILQNGYQSIMSRIQQEIGQVDSITIQKQQKNTAYCDCTNQCLIF